jgi:hypothetical protein
MRLIVSDKYRQAYLDHDINAMAAARADLRKLRVNTAPDIGTGFRFWMLSRSD